MTREINLLSSLPKPKRNIAERGANKTPEVITEAKRFGQSYFDGAREQGYGGYKYDGRYRTVAQDIIKFFNLGVGSKVLDIGCAKGFLVYDLMQEGRMMDVVGLDISKYALENCLLQVAHRVYWGSAEKIPFADKYFDCVISINTLHNLPLNRLIMALKEIERTCKGNSYIVVDAYKTEKQKELFERWVLTAETHMYCDEWKELFADVGYSGYYEFNILEEN